MNAIFGTYDSILGEFNHDNYIDIMNGKNDHASVPGMEDPHLSTSLTSKIEQDLMASDIIRNLMNRVSALEAGASLTKGVMKRDTYKSRVTVDETMTENNEDNADGRTEGDFQDSVKDGVDEFEYNSGLSAEIAYIFSAEWHHQRHAKKRVSAALCASMRRVSKPKSSADSRKPATPGVQEEEPEPKTYVNRLLINTTILQDEFLGAVGLNLREEGHTIVYPFKPLVLGYDYWKRSLDNYQQRLNVLMQDLGPSSPTVTQDSATLISKEEFLNGTTIVETLTEEQVSDRAKLNQEKTYLELLIRHLSLLIIFIDKDMKDIMRVRRQVQDGSLQNISFKDMWYLFCSGDIIIHNDDGKFQAYQVLHMGGGRPLFSAERPDRGSRVETRQSKSSSAKASAIFYDATISAYRTSFFLDCIQICFDGKKVGPCAKKFEITEYDGARPINSLEVYPLKFAENHSKLKEDLITRGRLFQKLANVEAGHVSHKRYVGLTVSIPSEEIDSDVIIDFRSSYMDKQRKDDYIHSTKPKIGVEEGNITKADDRETCEILPCTVQKCTNCTDTYDDRKEDRKAYHNFFSQNPHRILTPTTLLEISAEHMLLLPWKVNAYSLRDRRCYILDIDVIKEPAEDDEVMRSFDDLVIEQKHKELVLAMVKNHSRETVSKISKRHRRESAAHSADLVKGKGKGIIILLHGAPGVGKTSTAHCVAAFTNRPLYPITCGDIGDTAEIVEKNLDHHFRLAHQWGCVLLLDEADIFLAKREQGLSDVGRNGLVSVFLRVLEYYAGILFLTTNRVGSFDEAFQSRIHISLYYPPLTPYTAVEIWDKNLDRLARRDTLEIDREKILDYGWRHFKTTKWNGRQIRNAFQTATALAEYEHTAKYADRKTKKKPKLQVSHFKKVSAASKEFEKYLRAAMGRTYDAAAADEGLRADEFETSENQIFQFGAARPRQEQGLEVPQQRNSGGGSPSSSKHQDRRDDVKSSHRNRHDRNLSPSHGDSDSEEEDEVNEETNNSSSSESSDSDN